MIRKRRRRGAGSFTRKNFDQLSLCRTEQRTTALSAILRVSTVDNAAVGNGWEPRITRQSLIEQTEESSR